MNPLLSIKGTIALGFILALAVAFGMGTGVAGLTAAAMTWIHVLAGVVWIGLLYYFNFVQVPGVGAAHGSAYFTTLTSFRFQALAQHWQTLMARLLQQSTNTSHQQHCFGSVWQQQ